jgi:hypothetical protein
LVLVAFTLCTETVTLQDFIIVNKPAGVERISHSLPVTQVTTRVAIHTSPPVDEEDPLRVDQADLYDEKDQLNRRAGGLSR